MPLVERLVYRAVSRVMASRPSQWHVLPHGPIEPLAAGLWRVTGFTPPGALVPREMVLYRLAGSGLLVHSAVALDAAGIAQLESLGRPEVLVVPNRMHRIDAGLYKRRYPGMRVVCPAAARSIVEEVVAVRRHGGGGPPVLRHPVPRAAPHPPLGAHLRASAER